MTERGIAGGAVAGAALASALLLAGCGGGGAGANLPKISPTEAPTLMPTQPPVTVGDDWITFAHDAQRTGAQLQKTGITQSTVKNLALAWQFKSKAGFVADPIAAGGKVYVEDSSGVVTALDAATGKTDWHIQLPQDGSANDRMTPALYDGMLFLGTWEQAYSATKYYALAVDPQTGHTIWQTTLPGGLHGSPVALNGTLFVPVGLGDPGYCHPGGVYALNEHTGQSLSDWLTEAGATPDGGAAWGAVSLTSDQSTLLFGTGNTCKNASATGNSIVALNTALTPQWHIQTENSLVDDDVAGGVALLGQNGYVIGKNGLVYAVNPKSGAIAWSTSLGAVDGAGAFGTPGLTQGTLIISGGNPKNPDVYNPPGGFLFGLNPATGSKRWEIQTSYLVSGDIATTPDLAFAILDTSIAALDPATGAKLWTYPLASYSKSSVIVVPSGVYAADLSGRIYAFKLPPGAAAASARSGATGLSRAAMLRLQAVEAPIHMPGRPVFCKIP